MALHADDSNSPAADRRRRHARTYLLYVQPIVLGFGWLLLAATWAFRPDSVPVGVYWVSLAAGVFVLLFAAAAWRGADIARLMTINL